MISCTRIIGFDSGHRVQGHLNKCKSCHGHRYSAELHAISDDLNELGMVIDFAEIKKKVGGWIDEHWDHTFIVGKDDTEVYEALMTLPRMKDPFVLPTNPTAENMSSYLLNIVCPKELKGTGIKVNKVVLWETPNCFATAELGD